MPWRSLFIFVAIAALGVGTDDHGRDLSALVQWLVDNGANLGPIRPQLSDSGEVGVIATDDLEEGAIVLRIPQTLMITPAKLDVALEAAGLACESPLDDSQDEFRLALWLLLEQSRERRTGQTSSWDPALRALPKHIDLPVLWPADHTRWLNGTEVVPGLRSQQQEWSNGFQEVQRNCSALMVGVAISDWMWAMSNVVSRTYAIRPGQDETIAMIPFADLFNHELPSELSYSKKLDNGHFVMRTKRAIRLGAQLHSSYGMQLPKHWILNWGFLPAEAADLDCAADVETPRRIRVALPAVESGATADLRRELLPGLLDLASATPTSFTLGRQTAAGTRILPGSELALLLAHLRVLSVKDERTIRCIARHWGSSLIGAPASLAEKAAPNRCPAPCVLLSPVTLDAEARAMHSLRASLTMRRAAYGREKAADAARLAYLLAHESTIEKEAGISSSAGAVSVSAAAARRELLALRVVAAERRIISDHEELVDFILPLLEEVANATAADTVAMEAIVDRFCSATQPPKRSATEAEREQARIAAKPWQRFSAYLDAVLWPLLFSPHTEQVEGVDVTCGVDSFEVPSIEVGKECSRLAHERALANLEALSQNMHMRSDSHGAEL